MKFISIAILGLVLLFVMACSVTGQTLNTGSAVNDVNLELDYEEVIHYDCNNNITSDKVEVVAPPTQTVIINPTNPSTVGGSTFLDTSTGSTAPMVTGYTTFVIDHGDGALSMHVITGINTISYTFYTCAQWNSNGTCAAASTTIQEQGQLTINVIYTEKTIPTPLNVYDCTTPAPTPTPGPVKLIKH